MWNRSLDKLSEEELETLIRQRRAGLDSPKPQSTKVKPKTGTQKQRKGRVKILFLVEIVVVAGLLAVFGISARGWMASVLQAEAVGVAAAKDIVDAYTAYFTLRARVLQTTYDHNLAVFALRRTTGEFRAAR